MPAIWKHGVRLQNKLKFGSNFEFPQMFSFPIFFIGTKNYNVPQNNHMDKNITNLINLT